MSAMLTGGFKESQSNEVSSSGTPYCVFLITGVGMSYGMQWNYYTGRIASDLLLSLNLAD
jgi:membrane protein DedA with SNARE-associated domain